MANIYIAAAYWRSVKRGVRTWVSIASDEMRGAVNELAQEELVADTITAEQYAEWIGAPIEV